MLKAATEDLLKIFQLNVRQNRRKAFNVRAYQYVTAGITIALWG